MPTSMSQIGGSGRHAVPPDHAFTAGFRATDETVQNTFVNRSEYKTFSRELQDLSL
jgi:hypothetical protein